MGCLRRILFTIALAFVTCAGMLAQTTKVRGRVVDANGDPVPFAGVFFAGTTVGISTDLDGNYALETRDPEARILCCQMLGYDSQSVAVRPGTFTNINFCLRLTDNQLTGSVVKADNRKVKRLLAAIDAHREANDPDRKPFFRSEIYSKLELDLTHAEEQLTNKRFVKEFGFVFNFMDTSAVSGVPYLPMMISESVVDRRHSLNPDKDSEYVTANRISGINPDNNLLSQFTGSLHLKVNFYKPFINGFGVDFPSPIQNGGLLYYNYYIIDSLQVDGRKTYLVRYHPKPGISSPAFDGEMRIDAEDYAIRSIHAKMKHGGNVNWLRDIVIDADYQRIGDSTWFYREDKLYADFSVAMGDSSKVMSLLGTRQMTYGQPDFSPFDVREDASKVEVSEDAGHKDELFWDQARPYALTRKEQDIYTMIELIKDVPLYQTTYDLVYTIVNGYWDVGKLSYGPFFKLVSFNNLEGPRLQLGIRTSKDFSTRRRYGAYLAYGIRDGEFKGGLTYERMFSKAPTRKLSVDLHHDVFQLGRGTSGVTDANILSSILGKGDAQRLCPMSNLSVLYEHEFSPNFNAAAELSARTYFANMYVPMRSPQGKFINYVSSHELHLQARFSKDETVNRGHFVKKYMHTFHPVLTFDLTAGVPGFLPHSYSFVRPEFTLDWRLRVPPAGYTKIHFNAGRIFGTVPYPLLHLPEGNGTYVLDKTAFSCMDYFEFATDTWATLFVNHNFNGFFLGKIPALRQLNLREELTFRAVYGTLDDRNNPVVNPDAPMAFPIVTRPMTSPYMEVGAGISNILRIFRVDCFWRLNHLSYEVKGQTVKAARPFVVNLGMEFRF